jgi:hypothetical protein
MTGLGEPDKNRYRVLAASMDSGDVTTTGGPDDRDDPPDAVEQQLDRIVEQYPVFDYPEGAVIGWIRPDGMPHLRDHADIADRPYLRPPQPHRDDL